MSLAKTFENYWYSKPLTRWLFWPLHLLLSFVAHLKRWMYKYGFLKSYVSPVPTVVVGNITVGGTGKTPIICELVNFFKNKGIRVGLISRGYRSEVEGIHIVQKEDTATRIGDEAYLLKQILDIPFVIGSDRASASAHLTQNFELDLIVSDDGLQHYNLARDYELLMIDGIRGNGNGFMLPIGPLREPKSRLKSVDAIVVNSINESTKRQLSGINYFNASVVPEGLIHINSGELVSLSNLKENSVIAVAGIGNPERFFNTLEEFSNIKYKKVFDDHHHFIEEDFVDCHSDILVMTEKDATKCMELAKDNWYYLKIKLNVDESLFNDIQEKLKIN